MFDSILLVCIILNVIIFLCIYSYDRMYYIDEKVGYYFLIVLLGIPLLFYSMIKSIGGKNGTNI